MGVISIEITDIKRSEQNLRESEERFRTLADNISQFAWMTDETGYVVWYNKRWYEYTGTTLEEIKGWGWQKVIHPDHVKQVVEKFSRCLKTGEVWEDTFPLRSKTGEYCWFLSRAIPIKDEQGKITRWFGTNTDITERINIEEDLKRSEGKYRTLAENSPDIIIRFNREFRYIYVNSRAGRPLGRRPEEYMGKTIMEAATDKDIAKKVEANVREVFETGKQNDIEIHYESVDEYFHYRTVPEFSQGGMVETVLTFIRDISELRKAFREVKDRETKIDQILESISDGFFVLNKSWEFTYINQTAAQLLGYEPGELLGKNIWTEFPYLVEKGYDAEYRRVMENRVTSEFEMTNPINHKGYFSIKVYPEKNGVSVYWADITEKKKAEERRIEDVVNLATNMAHEMRTPLAGIVTGAYNIYRKCKDSGIQRSYENINKKVAEIDNVINELLMYTRVKVFKLGSTNIYNILKEAIESHASRFKKKHITVEEEISINKDLHIEADSEQLKILFNNILDNAYDSFTDKEGTIRLRGELDNSNVKITITDDGSGMEKEVLQKIFEPLYTTKIHGIGLGMPISKQIVKNHRGKLFVDSQKGTGTTVTIVLPIYLK